MNGNNDNTERGRGEFIAFGLIFFSFIIGGAGLVIGSSTILVGAFLVMLLGLLFFLVAN
jgi:hypothetical protein